MVELALKNVTKRFGDETAVEDLSLRVDGELLVLLGPSGCGKSTTLRCIAGLESVTEGTIRLGGQTITDRSPSDRSIAMVFQDYALYRTMTVEENMAYGLKHSTDLSATERQRKVQEIADLFDITELLDRGVDELSGGQKQRVALGRALVRDPEVFLLDEPLASLDAKLRSRMRTELQQIQDELGVTTIYVTHDQKEAMTMGDRVAILDDGRLQQVGPPNQVYRRPANLFVANFLGSPSMNTFEVRVAVDRDGTVCRYDGRDFARLPSEQVDASGEAVLGVRPEDVVFHADPERGSVAATVVVNEFQGSDSFLTLSIGDRQFTVVVPASVQSNPGDRVGVTVPPEHVHLFDAETGEAIRSPRDRAKDERRAL
ncbi:ABC transporter ATP-binding protein [Halorussus salinisoli]|uniref:ABC transporter ATP-binding protein n=1 Tax=Halorussus salinisoli TaxID=2558242 RepID=UPI0010C1AA6C|nr:ABC transporter ATP-binding protein [Halorussus salinisoli]